MLDYEGFRNYLIEQERAQNTIDSYFEALKEYDKAFTELNKSNLINYKQILMRKRKPKTVNLRICALNQYCKYIGKSELAIKRIKEPKKTSVENVISKEEYDKLIDGLKEDNKEQNYFLIKFLAHTGARVSEIIEMTKDDLDRGYCEMWTKGRIRRIYFPKSLIEQSKSYFTDEYEGYLFPNKYGEKMTTRGIAYIIRKCGEKYGIRKEVMHPHSFRHLYAIQFLKRDANIALLADLMGHSSVDTTAIYTRMSQEEQANRLNKAMDW